MPKFAHTRIDFNPKHAYSGLQTYLKTSWPILLLMLLVGLCSYLVIARIATSQDRENASYSQRLLIKSLEGQAVANFAIAKEFSTFKGAYENITLARNFDWARENYQSPNTSAILVYSATGGLVYTSISEQDEQHRAAIETIGRSVGQKDVARQNQEQLTNDFKRDDPAAFVRIGDYLATISSHPIRSKDWGLGDHGASAQDYVITIKYLGDYHAETIGRALGLQQLVFVHKLSAINKDAPKLTFAIKDSDEKLLGWYEWVDERRGTAALNSHLLPIGSGLAFLFVLTAFITWRSFHIQLSAQSARKTAEEASRLKSNFLANMSHELRTPLNAIIGYSEMLGEDCLDVNNETGAADAKKITRSAHHLLALINDLLDHSKIEAGKMDLNPAVHDIGAIIEEVADALRGRITQNASTLTIQCDPLIGKGLLDSMRLKQCLLNLVSNAAKFTKSGAIVIAARPIMVNNLPFIRVAIKDTGIGMSPETLKKLFVPFVQADETTAQNFGGTGLGLVITRQLIEAMGGSVRVESVLNQGSTFTLLVPRGMAWEGGTTQQQEDKLLAA